MEETEIDLFEHYETLPQAVQNIIAEWHDESYEECDKMLARLEPLGYTFEYSLDASPYNLTKIL